MQNNRAYVAGTVITVPEFSHEVLGEKFYDVTLSVRRLSDRHDEIPVTVSDRLMQDMPLAPGDTVGVSGQLRSYNKQTEGRSKLVLRIFARELDDGESDTPNRIELEGFICKPPVYRTTPFKREICDMLLAVNRAYNKSDYIPAIAWGRNARYAGEFAVGDKVAVTGRIQSRVYQKTLPDGSVEDRVAYEVSVSRLEKQDY
ncbi:MAG TPA: single-stranded DNA-binding protein [Candidatus Limadaptatus stercorigallinarum]|uniref:Single-stranded DNA-binding protein n=1 Tax=Candidatus Limadaptatus stercorigallinarum TaxID=2840845 RepID=A0A9D1HS14_9FIRM|nr:single-stranded DNA-binding protein [Candidatus Limadaptatus stercorigallinarum]